MNFAPLAPRVSAFVLAALAAASAVAWGLRWSAVRSLPQSAALAEEGAVADPQRVARALGAVEYSAAPIAAAATGVLASRLSLQGVVVPKGLQGGAALIAVDGKGAKPFRVGAEVVDGWRVVAVASRRAELAQKGEGPRTALEMAPLAAAATPSTAPAIAGTTVRP